jgi:hypothetical protein
MNLHSIQFAEYEVLLSSFENRICGQYFAL